MVAVTGQSPSPPPPPGQSVLEAVLERITYVNEDSGYTIARVATGRAGPDLLTVAGPLLGAQAGESLRLTGRWSSHPRCGRQFEVTSCTTVLPATVQGIRRYLGSGLVKGIGPVMAERMVAHFGAGILAVIETEPGSLVEVRGLGPTRIGKIADAWEEQKAIKEVMVFLSGAGVSTSPSCPGIVPSRTGSVTRCHPAGPDTACGNWAGRGLRHAAGPSRWLSGRDERLEGAKPMAGTADREVVLITGCSSGIGRAAAISLHEAGLRVYATARRAAALTDLASRGIHTLALDVTDETSMTRAVAAVEADAGTISVLINNAGYGLYGPVEQQPMTEIRRQFETNFFGLARLTQLVLPGMRRRRGGRILNVSSTGGRATLPGGAFYHASKYAVEALSDALRMEVAQFGIDVVLIEPGPVKTPWNEVAAASLSTAVPGAPDAGPGGSDAEATVARDPYEAYKSAVGASFATAQTGLLARLGSTAEDIAKVITHAVTTPRPRTRYLINPVAKSVVAMNRLLPGRAYDAVLRLQYRLPH
jgi:NADP-dependent 3-hydroxy acid dehydrogenase YdfG